MLSLSIPLAVCLITAPDSAPSTNPGIPLSTFQQVAIALEILDPRECKWTFAVPTDFATDLSTMRRRYEELHDAPPLYDAARFPGREFCNRAITMNRDHSRWLRDRLELFPGQEWVAEAIRESDELYAVYDAVRDCQCSYYYVTVRRKGLKALRERIGPWAYYGGFLPPPVPVWRFQRID